MEDFIQIRGNQRFGKTQLTVELLEEFIEQVTKNEKPKILIVGRFEGSILSSNILRLIERLNRENIEIVFQSSIVGTCGSLNETLTYKLNRNFPTNLALRDPEKEIENFDILKKNIFQNNRKNSIPKNRSKKSMKGKNNPQMSSKFHR